MANFEIYVRVFGSANLIWSLTVVRFRTFVSMWTKSPNWSCNSSGISIITKEIKNRFSTSAASSSLSSGKYRRNSISRDRRCSIVDVFGFHQVLRLFLQHLTILKHSNVSCITLRRQFCNLEWSACRLSRSWMLFVPIPFSFRFKLFNFSKMSVK